MGKPAASKARTVREGCIQEALAIVEEGGVEALSLREVARRLGVSHQAPYKHFPSRDHLLAELVARAFVAFGAHLDARPRGDNPHDDLAAMGRAYLGYASEHPLQYRLMFGTALPDPALHPDMMHSARHAYALLSDCLAQMRLQVGADSAAVAADALFVWSTMHGLAGILQSRALETLGLSEELLAVAIPDVMRRIGEALPPPVASSAAPEPGSAA